MAPTLTAAFEEGVDPDSESGTMVGHGELHHVGGSTTLLPPYEYLLLGMMGSSRGSAPTTNIRRSGAVAGLRMHLYLVREVVSKRVVCGVCVCVYDMICWSILSNFNTRIIVERYVFSLRFRERFCSCLDIYIFFAHI